MNLILGMDIWVFVAWVGSIIAAIICILYGLYNYFFKKEKKKASSKQEIKTQKKEEK